MFYAEGEQRDVLDLELLTLSTWQSHGEDPSCFWVVQEKDSAINAQLFRDPIDAFHQMSRLTAGMAQQQPGNKNTE